MCASVCANELVCVRLRACFGVKGEEGKRS